MKNPGFVSPDWPAPDNIRALTTTRLGGVSLPPFGALNVGDHVGDEASAVIQNRQLLSDCLGIDQSNIAWLRQNHGVAVVDASQVLGQAAVADASYARQKNTVCAVMTADCLPVLLTNARGSEVAAVHAGWRGLAAGVLDSTVAQFSGSELLMAWLGPAIGATKFEVGADVYQEFVGQDANNRSYFKSIASDKWLADLYGLAARALIRLGVKHIYGGEYCTYLDEEQFYSYRRDGQTGRMVSLIWME